MKRSFAEEAAIEAMQLDLRLASKCGHATGVRAELKRRAPHSPCVLTDRFLWTH